MMKNEDFQIFYEKYFGFSNEVIYQVVKDRSLAEEISQELFYHFYESDLKLDFSSEKKLRAFVTKASVNKALDYYKTIRGDIRQAYPYWPIGTSSYSDNWSALALDAGKKHYVAVWRRGGDDRITLPMTRLAGKEVKVHCAYPQNRPATFEWNAVESSLSVRMKEEICARLFEIEVVSDKK